jgi:transcription initiation factor TFIIIB Brf1 subunit/transcription initiation factor TFIIB
VEIVCAISVKASARTRASNADEHAYARTRADAQSPALTERAHSLDHSLTHSLTHSLSLSLSRSGPRTYATTAGISGLSRDSRERTIAQGNQRITHLAHSLGIVHAVVENAQGWFRLALQQNFLQGRQTDHVVAACLYIACRKGSTPHLLIDFSDQLQVRTRARARARAH